MADAPPTQVTPDPERPAAPTAGPRGGTAAPARPDRRGTIERLVGWLRELSQFSVVGALAFVIDMGLFNALQYGPTGVLAGHPNTSNVLSAGVATAFSWVANRTWTYRGRTRDNVAREALLFAFANVGGILITQFCLVFTHHTLGLTGPVADNVAAYVVGFGLGTAFRFIFYHYVVFTGAPGTPGTGQHPPAEAPSRGSARFTGAPAAQPSARPTGDVPDHTAAM